MQGNGWIYTDGGRAAAGRKGLAGDCAVRALAIIENIAYSEAYRLCYKKGFRAVKGMSAPKFNNLLVEMGYQWQATQAKKSEPRLKLHEITGTGVARVSRHFVAIINGYIFDNHDSRRLPKGRCVYGVWRKPEGRLNEDQANS